VALTRSGLVWDSRSDSTTWLVLLVAEDEAALRMTLGDRLRRERYEIELASDGDQAFEKATRVLFDLIILDVVLSCRDGLAVCRDLGRIGLATPILMLAALAALPGVWWRKWIWRACSGLLRQMRRTPSASVIRFLPKPESRNNHGQSLPCTRPSPSAASISLGCQELQELFRIGSRCCA
jgi:CheY-like chemotaxis protein